ncbi:MAG: hypothetical protein JW700_01540 [Candidatus Aenigmarchaeota archaeon]|nr:hypothetical protein [Candidatus Aenigmarchaeota archaeon]
MGSEISVGYNSENIDEKILYQKKFLAASKKARRKSKRHQALDMYNTRKNELSTYKRQMLKCAAKRSRGMRTRRSIDISSDDYFDLEKAKQVAIEMGYGETVKGLEEALENS